MKDTQEYTEIDSSIGAGQKNDSALASLQTAKAPDETAVRIIDIEAVSLSADETVSQKVPVDSENTQGSVGNSQELAVKNDLPDIDTVNPTEQDRADDFKFISITADVSFLVNQLMREKSGGTRLRIGVRRSGYPERLSKQSGGAAESSSLSPFSKQNHDPLSGLNLYRIFNRL
jgi:hypothetical protein